MLSSFSCDFTIGAVITRVIGCFFSFSCDFAVGAIVTGAFLLLDMISLLEPSLGFLFRFGLEIAVFGCDFAIRAVITGAFLLLDMISSLEPLLGYY
ncbi:28318_t:CDS:2 [Dentiscutata erythropus]|uniref:28318_t:CDS:1 n=1 Tax=Dentiscutata erythropus TaxID=1348616 RepID=A0A9N9AZ93_9GLOM|nr:28318_t:CDS:2 [Dentiscutata erythropus]